ncbi:MAG: hypothetical protein H6741_31000 [Alphaproteobacteria bacterium]|nr:hypothetical protein [Alphaproteobacteria bacterium]
MKPLALLALAAVASLLAAPGARSPVAEHLARVEARLRASPPAALEPAQRERREWALDVLQVYREAGRFPHNHVSPEGRTRPAPVLGGYPDAPRRTPVFIDPHGTRCAVGELLWRSGHEALALEVARRQGLAYVSEIEAPGLAAWAAEYGFTVEELAAIQPAYDYMEPEEVTALPPWIVGVGAAELGAATALTLNIAASRTGRYSRGQAWLGYSLGGLSLLGGAVLMLEARTGPHPAPAGPAFGYAYTPQTRYNLYGLGALGAVVGLSSVMASTYTLGALREREAAGVSVSLAPGQVGVSGRW